MNNIILFVKGMIIGIGKVIPGVSGSLIALAFGVYERSIEYLCNPIKNLKKDFTFMFILGLGIILSINLFSTIIFYCLNKYYLSTMLLFIGLIIGSVPCFKRKVTIRNKREYIKITLCILIFIFLFNINGTNKISDYNYFNLFFIGFLEATAMIIPGISGTALLMSLGYYEIYLEMICNILNYSFLIINIYDYISVLTGVIFGILIISKVINYCFRTAKNTTNQIIYSSLIASIISMILLTLTKNYNILEILIAIIFLVVGYSLSLFLVNKL
ncbi:MAG: DUF368 domain-containing protein [Mycoplasmatota bacterium]